MAYKTLVAASTKPLILSILSHGKSYGYQIIKNVENLSDGELSWTDAMLYPVLHRMESDGLIKSEWVIQDNGRKRKYYTITEKGREERKVTRAQWMNVNAALNLLWGSSPQLELG
ncbi:MAG: PadR family transcriptional regulator [Roseivirga sp.]|nr:PadR family transcriptional regulator [Roseivirga sp.]